VVERPLSVFTGNSAGQLRSKTMETYEVYNDLNTQNLDVHITNLLETCKSKAAHADEQFKVFRKALNDLEAMTHICPKAIEAMEAKLSQWGTYRFVWTQAAKDIRAMTSKDGNCDGGDLYRLMKIQKYAASLCRDQHVSQITGHAAAYADSVTAAHAGAVEATLELCSLIANVAMRCLPSIYKPEH
tara:strand:+ start:76 stop:633 length:558 start_codon:yes stop_codon:yes gene_type:complete